ncbi:helix-turn-helix transcriptional regulator [Polynucleobacter sp. 80A-SIGWE]|uniref:helix-turn-helix transcriptional regulator n=1 Tax=Polynucleobacter sp. 80A-SIGWE TaxID=2689100 RepID=UPI001C0AA996|nr:helix-turn-helix transcriptional regulator [Polynucleobacter sp. 80A-SIGWE]MBU3589516.1 helix-turn-helix transcriptional regulator [Polynucleobacter sp. 80A-SIGWE]
MQSKLKIDWLIKNQLIESASLTSGDNQVQRVNYQIPRELGAGYYEQLEILPGILIVHGVQEFTPAAAGQMISIGRFSFNFPEPTLVVQSITGGIAVHQEEIPKMDIIFKPGIDFFRHAQEFSVTPLADGSSTLLRMNGVIASDSSLKKLLGNEIVNNLYEALELDPTPAIKAIPTPISISKFLRESFSHTVSGDLQKLYAQSKIIEYFCALASYINKPVEHKKNDKKLIDAAHSAREYLLNLDGKLPTLDELGGKFGISSKRLNEQFAVEFGQSMYSFITDRRLTEAYEAIRQSDVPLKTIAARLGYSHVNNFIGAFTKKFGYPPGKLRQKL